MTLVVFMEKIFRIAFHLGWPGSCPWCENILCALSSTTKAFTLWASDAGQGQARLIPLEMSLLSGRRLGNACGREKVQKGPLVSLVPPQIVHHQSGHVAPSASPCGSQEYRPSPASRPESHTRLAQRLGELTRHGLAQSQWAPGWGQGPGWLPKWFCREPPRAQPALCLRKGGAR